MVVPLSLGGGDSGGFSGNTNKSKIDGREEGLVVVPLSIG